jgi:uncharacterized DUF497 family protein
MEKLDFSNITGFEWDEGNLNKNWDKHLVSSGECEEVFFNEPYFTYLDEKHSISENRYYVLGETNENRTLFIVFTIRKTMIRIISARDMNKDERKAYEDLKKNTEI